MLIWRALRSKACKGSKLLCLLPLLASAQTLPTVHGTAVSGRKVVLPDDVHGKVGVLIIGFSRQSSSPVGAWAGRLKADFAGNKALIVLRLPFLEDVPKMFRSLAQSGVARSAGADRDEVIPIFESEAAFKQLVHYSKPDVAYILLLDRAGTVRDTLSGDVASDYGRARERVTQLLER